MDKALITGLIIALVEALKRRGLPADLAPLAAVATGIVLNLINYVLFGEVSLAQAILQGIIMGLSAVGLYQTGRAGRLVLSQLRSGR